MFPQSRTKKRKQNEKTNKITVDAITNKPNSFQSKRTPSLSLAPLPSATSEGAASSPEAAESVQDDEHGKGPCDGDEELSAPTESGCAGRALGAQGEGAATGRRNLRHFALWILREEGFAGEEEGLARISLA